MIRLFNTVDTIPETTLARDHRPHGTPIEQLVPFSFKRFVGRCVDRKVLTAAQATKLLSSQGR